MDLIKSLAYLLIYRNTEDRGTSRKQLAKTRIQDVLQDKRLVSSHKRRKRAKGEMIQT